MSLIKTLRYYKFNPIKILKRLQYKVYEIRHPDEPWISQGAVKYCDEILDTSKVGLEWGSGRSTLWFAKRLKHLTSVEYNREWFEIVKKSIDVEEQENIELLNIELEHPKSDPTYDKYDPWPNYVKVTELFDNLSLDFVVVDGHYRQACVLFALPKIRPGGYLLIDNSNRMAKLSDWKVPKSWNLVHQSENIMTETTIWQRPYDA